VCAHPRGVDALDVDDVGTAARGSDGDRRAADLGEHCPLLGGQGVPVPGAPDPSGVFAELLLRMAGIPAEEAAEITRRPLPPLPSLEEARTILGIDAED